jgi:mercuric ion transport protein
LSGALASACCLGPLVLTVLGISGAAVATRLGPVSPYFQVLALLLLAGAFYLAYRPSQACGVGEACSLPAASRWGRILLWVAAPIVLLLAGFPWYSRYLF